MIDRIDARTKEAPAAVDPSTALIALLDALDALAEVFEKDNENLRSGSTERLAETTALKEERLAALDSARRVMREGAFAIDGDAKSLIAGRVKRLEAAVTENVKLTKTVSRAVRYVGDIIVRAVEKTTTPMTYGRSGETERPRELSASGLNAKI